MPWRHGWAQKLHFSTYGCLERAVKCGEIVDKKVLHPASWNNDGEDADGMMKDEGRE